MPHTTFIRSGFTMVPNAVVFHATLSNYAKRLFDVLEHLIGGNKNCWVSYIRLAKEIRCSRRWLPHVINELVEAGLLHVEFRLGKTNIYTLLLRVERRKNQPMHSSAPQPMHSSAPNQKPKQKTNKKGGSTPLKEPSTEEKYAKTAAYIQGKKVSWSK